MATTRKSRPSTSKKGKGSSSKKEAALSSSAKARKARAEAVASAKALAAAERAKASKKRGSKKGSKASSKTEKKASLPKSTIAEATARSVALAEAAAAAEAQKVSLTPPAERAKIALREAFEQSKKLGHLDDVKSIPSRMTTVHGVYCMVRQIAFGFVLEGENIDDIVASCMEAREEIQDLLERQYGTITIRYWTTFEWMKLGAAKGEGKSPELEWRIPGESQRIHRFFTGHPRVKATAYERNVRLKLTSMLKGPPVILLLAQIGGRIAVRDRRKGRGRKR